LSPNYRLVESDKFLDAGDSLLFDPVLANQCLLSSTIDNGLATSFVQEYKKYIEFQTTLAYLKGTVEVLYFDENLN
jgi:hypothetical protein